LHRVEIEDSWEGHGSSYNVVDWMTVNDPGEDVGAITLSK